MSTSHPTPQTFKQDEQAVQDYVAGNYEDLRYRLPYANAYHHWWRQQMVRMVSAENQRGVVLDNGCGVGMLFDHFPDAALVVGMDLSSGMLQKARQRSNTLVQGNSQQLPFPGETFDLVISNSLIHHLPEPETGVREMHRVLKRGGQLVVADTNRSILSTIPRAIAYRRDNFSEGHQNLHRREYLGWLSRYFTVQQVYYFGYLAYPFGFPDMMGPFKRLPFPVGLVRFLIQLDRLIGLIPGVRTQSWELMVGAIKS